MERYKPPLSEEGREAIKRKRLEIFREQLQMLWQTEISDAALTEPTYDRAFKKAVESLPEVPAADLENYDEERLLNNFEHHLYEEVMEPYLLSAAKALREEKSSKTKAFVETKERKAVALYQKLSADGTLLRKRLKRD